MGLMYQMNPMYLFSGCVDAKNIFCGYMGAEKVHPGTSGFIGRGFECFLANNARFLHFGIRYLDISSSRWDVHHQCISGSRPCGRSPA